MSIHDLPQDLLVEILSRLPVKSLLQCKPVCKHWYSLLRTPNFIYHHHDRNAAAATADRLLVKRFLLEGGDTAAVALSFVENQTPIEEIDISHTGLNIKQLQILGPCNGVVCLTRFALNTTIVLWNPSMNEFRVVPQPDYKSEGHVSNIGFGYDPYTDDYKVVRFAMMSTGFPLGEVDERIEVYEMRTDSWREVEAEAPILLGLQCLYHSYVSWNRDCFWYACPQIGYQHLGGGPVIMAFSMSDEVFEELPVPEACLKEDHSEKRLFVLDDSLAMVVYPIGWAHPAWFPPEVFPPEEFPPLDFLIWKTFDIWVMSDEKDVEVSWSKKFTIGPLQGIDWALGFRLNSEFLVESSYGQMVSYNLNTLERKEYEVHDQVRGHPPPPHLQVVTYVESLVSVQRQQ